MPGLGIAEIVQGTPAGYIVRMQDGSERLFPEHVLANAGYVSPTQSAVPQLPGPGSMDDIAPPSQPAAYGNGVMPFAEGAPAQAPTPPPAPTPASTSQSGSVRAGVSGDQLVKRNDVVLDTTPYNSDELDQMLGQSRDRLGVYRDMQSEMFGQRAEAERGSSEALSGRPKLDAAGQPVLDANGQPVLEGGLAQVDAAAMQRDAEKNAAFDRATEGHVAARAAEIAQKVAEVPGKDPTAYWHRGGAFQAAAGAAAGIFGGILAVTTGSGRNMGLEAIDSAIQDDLAAQETLIDNEWKKVAHDKESLEAYQDFRGRTRQRMLEGQIMRRESVRQHFLAKAATFQSKGKQLELAQAAADLGVQQEKDLQELLQKEREWGLAVSQDAFNRDKTAEAMRLEKVRTSAEVAYHRAQAAKLKAETGAKAEVNPPIYQFKDGSTMYLDPRYSSTMKPEDIEKFRQTAAKKDTFLIQYDDLIRDVAATGRKLMLAPGKRGLGDADVAALKNRAMKFALDYTNEKAATTFTDRLLDTVVKMSGSPTGITDVDKVPSMLEFKKSVIGEMDGQFRGRGAYVLGQPEAEGKLPSLKSFDAYNQYGADPRPSGPEGSLGDQLKAQFTDVMFGTDPKSQIQSLDGILNYIASPVGTGSHAVTSLLRNLKEVEVGGKKGLSNRGGQTPLSKEAAIKRLSLQRSRLKARAPEQADRIDDMFDELEKYLNEDYGVVDTRSSLPDVRSPGFQTR